MTRMRLRAIPASACHPGGVGMTSPRERREHALPEVEQESGDEDRDRCPRRGVRRPSPYRGRRAWLAGPFHVAPGFAADRPEATVPL